MSGSNELHPASVDHYETGLHAGLWGLQNFYRQQRAGLYMVRQRLHMWTHNRWRIG